MQLRPGGTRVAGPPTAPSLAEVWPEVSGKLVAYLRGRGAGAALAEDVVQDVALKALARDVPFESAGDLLRWCYPVPRNQLVDHHRSTLRLVAMDETSVEEQHAAIDVHAEVEARLRLRRVLAGLRQLRPVDRECLAAAAVGEDAPACQDRREATRLAVRRHRARARLLELVGPPSAAVAWLLGRRPRPAVHLAPAALALPLLLGAAAVTWEVAPAPEREVPTVYVVPAADRPPLSGDEGETTGVPTAAPATTPRPATQALSGAAAADVAGGDARVAVGQVAVGTGTRPDEGRQLVCVDGLVLVEQVCVEQPAASAPTAVSDGVGDDTLPAPAAP